MQTSKEILSDKNLRITNARIKILDYFKNSNKAFSHTDLEKLFSQEMDRVSIYRILHAFVEKDILCKIIDSNATVLYSYAGHQHKSHDHPHFKCNECDNIQHLPALPKQYLEQLHKNKVTNLQLTVEGTCDQCLNKNE
ncbi:MAG TPA: transcriptional repressor [Saprospiraceae bacterium]|nr:transcriptional repressor [Saprospiraceae bacterium]